MLIAEVIVKGGNHHVKTSFDGLLTDSALKHHRSAADNLQKHIFFWQGSWIGCTRSHRCTYSNRVATQCKLNCTFRYPLTAMLAFSANRPFKPPELQVMLNKTAPSVFLPADVVKKILCSWPCQSNPIKDYKRRPSYRHKQLHTPDSLGLRRSETSHHAFIKISLTFCSSSFSLFSSWPSMSSTSACTPSLGLFFSPMLASPS